MKDIVRRGYDKVSYAYRNELLDNGEKYFAWLVELTLLLPPGAQVLDLGCGCGVPVARTLAKDFAVTGVDLSPVQIERVQALVPSAKFLCDDMSQIDFAPKSFAAVMAFYSIIHLPVEEHPQLFGKIRKWLQTGGYFMAIVGHTAWTGTENDWLVPGATMFWSHADAQAYQRWLEECGFTVLWSRFVPDGSSGHTLMLAKTDDVVERR